MSLFQCQNCGCCENTALACQGCDGYAVKFFDWTGIEDRKGLKLCSACAPTRYADEKDGATEFGKWHGQFDRVFLPLGVFKTNRDGNLEHVETGSTKFRDYAIPTPLREHMSYFGGFAFSSTRRAHASPSCCNLAFSASLTRSVCFSVRPVPGGAGGRPRGRFVCSSIRSFYARQKVLATPHLMTDTKCT